uniref:Uncharacterized protein n=1 Tax=Opuntia streptacantha TaxID=393608 RepID=A0A7C9AYR4_OPUST
MEYHWLRILLPRKVMPFFLVSLTHQVDVLAVGEEVVADSFQGPSQANNLRPLVSLFILYDFFPNFLGPCLILGIPFRQTQIVPFKHFNLLSTNILNPQILTQKCLHHNSRQIAHPHPLSKPHDKLEPFVPHFFQQELRQDSLAYSECAPFDPEKAYKNHDL